MNTIKKIALSLGIVSALTVGASALLYSPQVSAACSGAECARDGANNVQTGGSSSNNLEDAIQVVTNILLFIVGVVAVIMIVIGGLKYVASNGDSNQIQSAKNTILYAVIGLIVAVIAYAVVQFVIDAFMR